MDLSSSLVKTNPTLPRTRQLYRRQAENRRQLRTLDVGKKALVLGEVGHEDTDGATNHGVLSHEDGGAASQALADLVHLLGGDLKTTVSAFVAMILKLRWKRTLSTETMKIDLLSSSKLFSFS